MWDRLTATTPTVTLESTFRQPIRRFTVSRTPPFRLSFHLCFRVVPVCVSSFPVGSFGERALRGGHACEAPRIVLRGFVNLPLFVQGQRYVFYLFCATAAPVPQEEVGQSHLSRPA